MDFSEKVLEFAINNGHLSDFPTNLSGQVMNVEYWQNTEQQLGVRVNAHQLEIRKKASDLQSARTMTAFEIKEIELQECRGASERTRMFVPTNF